MLDFSSLRVLVVGDVMVDRYLSGRVDRISPEAPVPVILLGGEENRLGGAANVALNLRALGVRAGLAGAVGADRGASIFRTLLAESSLGDGLIVTDPQRQTTVKTRIVAQSQQLLRADREDTRDLDEATAERLLGGLRTELATRGADLILLQDYNKGVLSEAVIGETLELAREFGVLTAVDPKDKNFWSYRGVDLFKPNLREIQQQVGFDIRPQLADLDRAADLIFGRLACRTVMITLSEHGIYLNDGKRSEIYPTLARKIADVSGAGDTVISVAACALAAGMPPPDVARLANLAGAQVIARPGVSPVDPEELRTAWKQLYG